MSAPNFVLISELQTLTRRDFPLVDSTILQPTGAAPLLDGEWVELASASYAVQRATTGQGALHEGKNMLQWPVSTERGRYDTQAIGKVNVLFSGMYEAETAIVDTTSLVVGSLLTVQDKTIQGVALRRALALQVAAGSTGIVIVGVVSRLTTTNTGTKVRFVHFANQVMF